jgi:hypothetical protein
VFGLPVEPIVEAFLSPKNGRYGSLNVDILVEDRQSEFSLLTGLSAQASVQAPIFFYARRRPIPQQSSNSLTALGYRTMLIELSSQLSYYDEFYRSIGISERIFTDDFDRPSTSID